MPMRPPQAYAAEMLLLLQVPPTSTQVKFYAAMFTVIQKMIREADVTPTGTPPMVAPPGTGGGPVTGLGKVV